MSYQKNVLGHFRLKFFSSETGVQTILTKNSCFYPGIYMVSITHLAIFFHCIIFLANRKKPANNKFHLLFMQFRFWRSFIVLSPAAVTHSLMYVTLTIIMGTLNSQNIRFPFHVAVLPTLRSQYSFCTQRRCILPKIIHTYFYLWSFILLSIFKHKFVLFKYFS